MTYDSGRGEEPRADESAYRVDWNFFSNYTHVLVCLAENPHARQREVADRVGITERTAVRLITQLDEAGVLIRVKEGRRNSYVIDTGQHLRHPVEEHCTVGELLKAILDADGLKRVKRRFAAYRRERKD